MVPHTEKSENYSALPEFTPMPSLLLIRVTNDEEPDCRVSGGSGGAIDPDRYEVISDGLLP